MKFTLTKSLTIAMLLLSMQAGAQSANNKKESYNSYGSPKRSMTVGIASAISGYIPVYYEREINNRKSFQLGAGVTFRSILNDFANSAYYSTGKQGNDRIIDAFYNYNHRYAIPGVYLESAIKFYPSGNCMNDFFLAPTVTFINYNYLAQKIDEHTGAYTDKYQHEYRNLFGFTFNYGHHLQASSGLVFSWNCGLGLFVWNSHRQDLYSQGYGSNEVYVNGVFSKTVVAPRFSLNIAVGGIF